MTLVTNTRAHCCVSQSAVKHASRKIGDSHVILFQIYWSIYLPIAFSL